MLSLRKLHFGELLDLGIMDHGVVGRHNPHFTWKETEIHVLTTALILVSANVTIFGRRIFKEVIKLK